MLHINIICVGKLKEKYLQDALAEYSKRLSKYCNLNIIELPDEKLPNNLNEAINNALNSEFIKTVLPQKTINNYIDDKKQEWDIYNSITDKFKAEKELYFEKF